MPNFNAGAIEATLTLDRSPFTAGIRAARGQAAKLEQDGVEVKLDVDRDELDEVQRDIREMSKEEKIEFSVETAEAERRLKNFEDQAERTRRQIEKDAKIELKADLDAARARQQLAVLTRNRNIRVFVNLVNMSRVQNALRSLSKITISLSGANVVKNQLESIKNGLENIDKIAYRVGGLTVLFGNLANVLLTAGANTWTFIGSLGALGGLLVPLPVLLGSIATAVGVLAIAFTGWGNTGNMAVKSMLDMQQVLEDLTPAWNGLLKEVRAAAWDGVAETFRTFAETLLPTFKDGLVNTASAMNGFGKQLLTSLTNVDPSIYENIFAGISSSIKIASGGIQPFVDAFATLGSVGSDNLDRFAQAITNGLTRFNDFIQAAAQSGELQQWIDNAAVAFSDLMTVLGQAGGILNGFADAFKAAGSTTLSTLADTLTRIHTIVDSPAFQTGLTTIFTGVLAGAEGLANALGPIGDALGAMAPTISHIAQLVGETLGSALTYIAGAISTPAFQGGLTAFFDGLAAGVLAIGPYLPQIAAGIGAIGQVAGAILANVGPALGALLAGLGDILVAILPELLQIVDVLGAGLLQVITTLVPALLPLVQAIAALAVALAPALVTIVLAIADALAALAPTIAVLLVALVPLIKAWAMWIPLITGIAVDIIKILADNIAILAPFISAAASAFLEFMTAIQPLIPKILELVASIVPLATSLLPVMLGMLPALTDLFHQFMAAVVPIIPDLIELVDAFIQLSAAILPIVVALIPPLISLIQVLMPIITLFTSLLITGLAVAMRLVANGIQSVVGSVNNMTTSLRQGLGDVQRIASGITEAFDGMKAKITGAFSGARGWLRDAPHDVIDGFTGFIRGKFDSVRKAFSALTDLIPDWKGPKSRDRVLLKPNAHLIMRGLVEGVEEKRSDLRRKLGDVTNDFQITGKTDVGGSGSYRYPVQQTGAQVPQPATVGAAAQVNVKVEVPNAMNPDQVGTHVATKLGLLLSTGATPILSPVVADA